MEKLPREPPEKRNSSQSASGFTADSVLNKMGRGYRFKNGLHSSKQTLPSVFIISCSSLQSCLPLLRMRMIRTASRRQQLDRIQRSLPHVRPTSLFRETKCRHLSPVMDETIIKLAVFHVSRSRTRCNFLPFPVPRLIFIWKESEKEREKNEDVAMSPCRVRQSAATARGHTTPLVTFLSWPVSCIPLQRATENKRKRRSSSSSTC